MTNPTESTVYFTETGETIPLSQLTPEQKKLLRETWSKRFAQVITDHMRNHPEEIPTILPALQKAGVHCEIVETKTGIEYRLNGAFNYVVFLFGDAALKGGVNRA